MTFLENEPPRKKKKKPAKPPARRRATPRWVTPASRAAMAGAFFVVALGGPAWLWQSGWVADTWRDASRSAVTASTDIGLTVREVLLEGRVYAPRSMLKKAVGLQLGDPIMAFDPAAIRNRLEALPWVETAIVERRLPDTVRIRVVEREPIALWQRKGKLSLVGRNGAPITGRNLGRFNDLVVIVGKDAPRHAGALLTMLAAEPTLVRRVRAAVRVGARRWNLKLDNGIHIRLPETDPAKALARLAELDRRHGLLGGDIETIDLRLPDRLIVRTRDDRPALPVSFGKRT